MIGNHGTVGLARRFGTPQHVIHERRLARTATEYLHAATSSYKGTANVHFAVKCNSVPAVIETILAAGLGLEVMTECELALALRLGCDPNRIIVNGPCKTESFLRDCLAAGVRLTIVDSIDELLELDALASATGCVADILLRINPDYIPRGMNRGTATASRKGCAFGLDLAGGEAVRALEILDGLSAVRFRGIHFHLGTGIRSAEEYARAIQRLVPLFRIIQDKGGRIEILDVGGGFASPTTRELSTKEMLMYQVLNRLPELGEVLNNCPIERYTSVVSRAVEGEFSAGFLPEIIYEPGRSIASSNQLLLLTVRRVKERPGAGRWLIADGGLSTVTLPTYYEYHEVFLCNDVRRPRVTRATIIGPACFAGDIVYRNKLLPDVSQGEVLAIMDSGAYFTALESSFGFPRPAIVAVNGAHCRLVRSRETFDEMIERDILD
ncbi:MAG: hypothetical protein AB1428_13760 [Bacteroidota bacterium]